MDTDTIRRNIGAQRRQLADLLDTLEPGQWATRSMCAGWTVRDVAVHLTHGNARRTDFALAAIKSGFRFDATVRRMAVTDPADPAEITTRLRALADSSRRPPLTQEIDPLLDLLIHTQDICTPLGIDRRMPTDAAVAVAERLWQMKFPFTPQRDLPGYRFVATDTDFAVGPSWGALREAPIHDIVLMFARRRDVPDAEPDPDAEADPD